MFQFLQDILYKKKGDQLQTVDDEYEYNAYMINRWCTMYSPQIAIIINETVNKYWELFYMDDREHYKYMLGLMPRLKYKRLNYINKGKTKEKEDNKETYQKIAKMYKISTREVEQYIDSGFFDKSKLKPFQNK